ncbi:DUF7426 family protein [Rhodococcoides fascians]|uniref:DUF7426 family protein n=1 Tax=Rhodococcoides fascians TaxID=1828 RepID=UPI00055D79C7|nr:hypothetical protein [Rhodococcus fascians]
MGYDNLREFYDPAIVLPIGKKSYRIESPNADEGLRLRQILTEDAMVTDSAELAEVLTLLGAEKDPKTGVWSGGVYGEMKADGITWPEIFHAGRTALLHYGISSTLAETHWHTGVGDTGNPMPPEPKSSSTSGAARAKGSATATSRAPRARTDRKTQAAGRGKRSSASAPGTTT